MKAQNGGIAFDRELRTRLKEVRDEQPSPDYGQLNRLRELALRRAQMRRWFRTTTVALTATTAILAGIVLPKAITPPDDLRPRPIRMAQVEDSWAADPWVEASSRRTSIEGDGWIPRHWAPNS